MTIPSCLRKLHVFFEILNVNIMYVASLSCLCPLRDGRRALWPILVTKYWRSASPYPSSGFGWLTLQNIKRWFSPGAGILHDHCKEVDRSWCQSEILLHCFGLRHRAKIDCREFQPRADPRALKRKHHHCRCRSLIMREFFPVKRRWYRRQWSHDTSSQNVM